MPTRARHGSRPTHDVRPSRENTLDFFRRNIRRTTTFLALLESQWHQVRPEGLRDRAHGQTNKTSKRPPIDSSYLTCCKADVQLGRPIPILIFFDRSKPEPERLAAAMVSAVIFIFGWCQDIVTGKAPNMESSAAVALPDIVQGRDGNWCRPIDWMEQYGKLRIPIPEYTTVFATFSSALRPSRRIETF